MLAAMRKVGGEMAVSRNAVLPYLTSRESYFDFFDGLSVEIPDELEKRRRLRGGLLKSYLLETVGPSESPESLERILLRSHFRCQAVPDEEGIYRIIDDEQQGIALVEAFDNRYLALYTLLPTDKADALVRKAVASNPMLDHLWLSSEAFNALWAHVRSVNSGKRYGRITFEHESLFDVPDDPDLPPSIERERRASRFTMVDRLEEIDRRIPMLQSTYSPLHSITHMRLPASMRGGHDLYFDGKVTNRSDSFLDHRSAIQYVVNLYSTLTARLERKLWFSELEDAAGGMQLQGAIAELVFSEPLSEDTFRRWVMTLFNNRRNRFRITGFHTWLSDRKVQANAIDQHLWQPIILELTPHRVVGILPRGTCGNTINRLVSNIQRFVDPNVHAYIGDSEYGQLIPRNGSVKIA